MATYATDTATSGADTLRGAADKDYQGTSIDPQPGVFTYNAIWNKSDQIFGLDGADLIIGDLYETDGTQNFGYDSLYGGNGNDTIYGDTGPEDPNRALLTKGSTNKLYGGFGNDKLYAGNSTSGDYLYGEENNDTITGGQGADYAYGGSGSDAINGGEGNDLIYGGEGNANNDGNDTIRGGQGDDYLYGNRGSDLIYGGDGGDYIDGDGSGSVDTTAIDTLSYIDALGRVHVDLEISGRQNTEYGGLDSIYNIEALIGSNYNDRLQGQETAETLRGADGNDLLRGRDGNDKLYGEDDSDSLQGGAGNDKLDGGLGNDHLYGEAGKDNMTGGGGTDKFYFTSGPSPANVDVITDFTHGIDKICLKKTIFTNIGASLSAAELKIGSSASATNDYLVYNKATGTLYYDKDGTGGSSKQIICTVDDNTTLSYNDFLMV